MEQCVNCIQLCNFLLKLLHLTQTHKSEFWSETNYTVLEHKLLQLKMKSHTKQIITLVAYDMGNTFGNLFPAGNDLAP